jgi:two-component sensor histidine kinase
MNLAVQRRDGGAVWVDISSSVFEMGGKRYIQGIFRDVTERKRMEEELRQSLQEKETLVKEVHHRVKNNLAVVSSLLRLQSRQLEDEQAQGMISDSGNRVQSLSMLHEKLCRSEDVKSVAIGEYVRDLAQHLFRAFGKDGGKVRLAVDTEGLALDVDLAIPCGLIVNELVTNALKHAFPDGRSGEVRVGFRRNGERGYELNVRDDGTGMAPEVDPWTAGTLGMQIVTQLAAQLDAELEVEREGGTGFTIRFEEKGYD